MNELTAIAREKKTEVTTGNCQCLLSRFGLSSLGTELLAELAVGSQSPLRVFVPR